MAKGRSKKNPAERSPEREVPARGPIGLRENLRRASLAGTCFSCSPARLVPYVEVFESAKRIVESAEHAALGNVVIPAESFEALERLVLVGEPNF